ncbi:hypothetical protein [Aestuariivirga sp.]|uniref:hypothetical protein n=1 Tax=Aestuariivirga sp. TaxID=2650926 RepID=UPI003593A17B
MKMIKMALLGGAALAVTSAGAYADELSDLKAQIEALNSRMAAMEAAPAVPAGYSLMTVSKGEQIVVPGLDRLNKQIANEGNSATIISVLPTADAPAGTEIAWSGYARAGLVYVNGTQDYKTYVRVENEDGTYSRDVIARGDNDYDDLDVYARGQIKVVGKTDTAVGEVGATINLRGNLDGNRRLANESTTNSFIFNGGVYVEEAWGWWAMTPELTLGGGFTGSLGNIGYGYDGACTCYYTDNADVALNPGDSTQMRLTYASGPFFVAIALEDATGVGGFNSGNPLSEDNNLGVAGEIKYAGDMFSGEISGVWRSADDEFLNAVGVADPEDPFAVGAGIGFALGDIANISAGAAMGQYNNGQDFWRASILASANLSDEVHAEIAYGYTSADYSDQTVNAVLAGIYYDPVDKLTIGLEGEWIMTSDFDDVLNADGSITEYDDAQSFQVDLVTVFRF